MSTIIHVIGLTSCAPNPTNPPQPPPKAPNPEIAVNPPPADRISVPDQSQPGVLNARSAKYGTVYVRAKGVCAVHHPWPEGTVLPSGIQLNLSDVPCPEEMKDPAFQGCMMGLLRREDATHCLCEPVLGNPPMPGKAHDCPKT